MQKVFRLLRHNTESGPFTIGELLQQQIGPDDLIWVDGESTAWAYPQEMDNLKYALSPNDLVKKPEAIQAPKPVEEKPKPAVVQSAIHLSPAKEIERKAEELRQRTLSFKKMPGYEPAAWAQPPNAPVLPLADDVDFVYHRKKGLPVGEVLMGAMVVSLLTLGWYAGGKNLFRQPKELASAVAVKLTATEENTANGTALPAATDTTAVALEQTNSLEGDSTASTALNQPVVKRTAVVTTKDTNVAAPKELPAAVVKTAPEPVKKEEDKPAPKPSVMQSEPKEEVKAEPATVKKAEEQSAIEPEEKKKGFHLFKGLFKKKKKGDDKGEEDVKPEGQ